MAVAYVAAATGGINFFDTSATFSKTVAAGSDRLLVVVVALHRNSGNEFVSGITFNGGALTQRGSQLTAGLHGLSVWYLVAPDVATGDVVISIGGSAATVSAAALDFTGVNQVTPFSGTDVTGTGTGTAISNAISAAVGELVLDAAGIHDSSTTLTVGADQTERVNYAVGSGGDYETVGISTEAGAATNTMSWTAGATRDWAQHIVRLNPAGSGDSTPPTLSSATASPTGPTTGSGSVTTDEANGTLYFVVTTSATGPSAAQVQAGQDHTGSAAVDSGSQAVSATGAQSITGDFTGLTAGTTYYAHYQHRDAATNDSAVASSAAFTTYNTVTGTASGTSSDTASAELEVGVSGTATGASSDSATAVLGVSITGTASGSSADAGTVSQTYSIMGTVTLDDVAVSGALVYLVDQSTDTVIATQTTAGDGTYEFASVAAGTYHAVCEHAGHSAPSVSGIVIG